jgi:hypothetical protein
MKKPNHRKFDYEPRYYDPSKDKDEQLKRRLGFSRRRKSIGKNGGVVKTIVIGIIVLLAYLFLSGIL